jgi:arsenate reductase
MAEAYLRKYAGDRFEVYSAGLEPKDIHPLTVRVLREVGIDTSDQYAKGVDRYLGRMDFGYVITVCSRAEEKCPIFPSVSVRLHWPFEDPAASEGSEDEKLDKFREVRDQIDRQVRLWLEETSAASS